MTAVLPPLPQVFTLLNGDLAPRRQEIEIASTFQIPLFQIIGLPGPEVAEAKDRVRSAIESCEFPFPQRKIVLNLSPASVRKQGTGLDLPMAVAVLLEGKKIEGKQSGSFYAKIFAWGELGLDGRIKSARQPARALEAARAGGADLVLVAAEDEACFRRTASTLFDESLAQRIRGIAHLREIWEVLEGRGARSAECLSAEPHSGPARATPTGAGSAPSDSLLPLPPATAKILQLASAGAHHFLLLGPKGVGKSLALEWFLALHPALDRDTLRLRMFLSEISGRENEGPFRRVSTQAKAPALVGSYAGGMLRPGEFSLAHGGVLLADEFPEWSRDAREALREPLERRAVSLTRVGGAIEFPADFIFAGNGNLCPCGGVPDARAGSHLPPCRCHAVDRSRYLARLSGPILDRIDLVTFLYADSDIEAPRATFDSLRERTDSAREALIRRYGKLPGKMSPTDLEEILRIHPPLREKLDRLPFRSFRDRHKTLRLALTLAALQDRTLPDETQLREARALRLQAETLGGGAPKSGGA